MADEPDNEGYEDEDDLSAGVSSRAKQKAGAKKRKLEQLVKDECLRNSLRTYEGRAVLWNILNDFCHTFDSSFTGEFPHTTAFREGERSIGLKIFADMLKVSPSAYLKMSSEAEQRKQDPSSARLTINEDRTDDG